MQESDSGASELGKGGGSAPQVTKSQDPSAPPRVPKRILVVDDSRTMRLVLRRWLDRSEYQVVDAQNGDEALEKFKASEFDLVTLDIDMPVLDGFSFCARLRDWEQANGRHHTPVLIVTSHDTLADRERGFEVGATDFLAKPVAESEFLARIDRLLRADDRLLGLTVLVVDDSRVARKSIAASLLQHGITVIEAGDGLEAFHILESRPKEIDLMLTDYDMPKMGGDELCRRARTTLGLPWLPIIILSALADRARVLELFAAGATDYLCKPFTSEELAARISVHVEIRRLNRECARQIAELERLNELKNGFLAIASHDLRSPLNGILGAANIMLGDPNLSPSHRELADLINQSGDNLLQIINDLLDLARIEAGKTDLRFEVLDLPTLADQACNSLQPIAAPKNVTVSRITSATGGRPTVYGVRNDVLRLLTNVISNAIKFTPSQGQVTVSTGLAPDGVGATIVVSDTGIGIAADKLPLLFDRFSKLSQVGTAGELSTGLGMAIVKEIVERHSGSIAVVSQPGKGTSITITLPART
jgi:two-component system, sensor histidine kinase and response regulator